MAVRSGHPELPFGDTIGPLAFGVGLRTGEKSNEPIADLLLDKFPQAGGADGRAFPVALAPLQRAAQRGEVGGQRPTS